MKEYKKYLKELVKRGFPEEIDDTPTESKVTMKIIEQRFEGDGSRNKFIGIVTIGKSSSEYEKDNLDDLLKAMEYPVQTFFRTGIST